jgi:hypothetical protein
MLANQSYNTRVQAGKSQEAAIIATLRANGVNIQDPTENEDKFDKIDGWIIDGNTKKSLQIKFREENNDTIFEAIKDIDRGILGRDLISKADLYLVVDSMGIGRLVDAKNLKKLATQIKDAIMPVVNKGITSWHTNSCDIKITTDKYHGNRKLMIFFNPEKLNIIKSWKFDLTKTA